MNSSVPYLVKAMKEWIQDNGFTPYLVISADATNVEVPREHVKDGKIVLNISPSAVRDFYASEQGLGFSGRFSGVAREIFSPLDAVEGIFAKENGRECGFRINLNPTLLGRTKGEHQA